MHAEDDEGQVGDQRLGLPVGAGAPERAAEPCADHAAQVAGGELAQAGDAGGAVLAMHDDEVELLAAPALAFEAFDVPAGLVERGVRAPREPPRDLWIAGELEQRGGVVGLG